MFKCPQNGILGGAESSQTFLVKNFPLKVQRRITLRSVCFEIGFWYHGFLDLRNQNGNGQYYYKVEFNFRNDWWGRRKLIIQKLIYGDLRGLFVQFTFLSLIQLLKNPWENN